MVDYELLFRCVIAIDILLCAAILVCNILLLLSILLSKSARARTRSAMLVSMCVADLLVGGFTHPIYIHSYYTGTLFRSCEMHILMQLIGDYSQDFVCYWTLVTLGTVYVQQLAAERWGWSSSQGSHYEPLTPPRSKFHKVFRVAKKALLVGWPWLGTLLIPIPILMANVDEYIRDAFWDETFCPLHTPFVSRMVVMVLVFYLPIAALLLLSVGIGLVMYWDMINARQCDSRGPQPLVGRDGHRQGGRGGAAASRVRAGSGDGDGDARANGHANKNDPEFRTEVAGQDLPLCDLGGEATHNAALTSDSLRSSSSRGNSAIQPSISAATISTQGMDPSVILVGEERTDRPTNRGPGNASTAADSLERPAHVLVPFLVTAACALPLMIGWWFYEGMEQEAVVIVSVTLSRVYLLRAALLPVAWFTLPELRQALAALWDCLIGRGAVGSRPRGEMGEFSVAYTTLRETPELSSSHPEVLRSRDVRRQNPFDSDVRV